MTAAHERAAALSRKMNPLLAVLPKKNREHSVADVTDFATAPPVNPVFLVLLTIRLSLVSPGVPFLFWRWTAWRVSRSLLEGISRSLWLILGFFHN